jgi:hypothetical protein
MQRRQLAETLFSSRVQEQRCPSRAKIGRGQDQFLRGSSPSEPRKSRIRLCSLPWKASLHRGRRVGILNAINK